MEMCACVALVAAWPRPAPYPTFAPPLSLASGPRFFLFEKKNKSFPIFGVVMVSISVPQ